MRIVAIVPLLFVVHASAALAQSQIEAHGRYSRTIHTEQSSWGGGAYYQHTLLKSSAVQLAGSLGADWSKQESSGPSTTSVGVDLIVQPGGQAALTPFAGAGASANWLSGDNAPSGTLHGFDGIVGLQYTPSPKSPWSFDVQVRPGYVKTQEHEVTYRLGAAYSLH